MDDWLIEARIAIIRVQRSQTDVHREVKKIAYMCTVKINDYNINTCVFRLYFKRISWCNERHSCINYLHTECLYLHPCVNKKVWRNSTCRTSRELLAFKSQHSNTGCMAIPQLKKKRSCGFLRGLATSFSILYNKKIYKRRIDALSHFIYQSRTEKT